MSKSGKIAIGVFAAITLASAGAGTVAKLNEGQAASAKPAASSAGLPLLAAPATAATTYATTKPTPSHTTKTAKPSPTSKAAPKPRPTTRKPTPKPTKTTSPTRKGVHPGAFCSPEGARGTTSAGTAMRCTRKAGEDQARWRKA